MAPDEKAHIQAVGDTEPRKQADALEGNIVSLEDAKRALDTTVTKNKRLIEKLEDTQARLRDSETTARTLLNAAPDGAFLLDRRGRVLACNAAAGRRFAMSVQEMTGRCLYELFAPHLGHRWRGYVDRAFRAAQPTHFEDKYEDRTLNISIYPVDGNGGDVSVCAVYAHDITDSKAAELVAKELLQMKSDLVANVSHELRTPICSLKGLLGLLAKGKLNDPQVQQEFLVRASDDANRLAALVDDLLDLSRLEADELELQWGRIEMQALIAETLCSVEVLAGEKQVSLQYEVSDAPLVVQGDRRRLQQVLTNLCSNAIEFSEPHHPVRVTAGREDDQLVVRVFDEGPGIAPDALPKLFGRFCQVDTVRKRRGQGSGLGLYISRQIIEAHSGQIGVESELDKGSMFFFTLPL